jgi:Protein of unknown function (DUF3604)
MIKKIFLGLVLVIASLLLCFYVIGKGWPGGPWSSAPVAEGPRPMPKHATETLPSEPQILFGDLHNHTNYSIDAYLFNSKLVKGSGMSTPADACDFARYCSALDFWSINDHAEGLTPRVWADTVEAIRNCNATAGDQSNPDMVSFVGWEWSQGGKDVDAPSHYGHKNVIVRTWEDGQTPTRPIASEPNYIIGRIPAPLRGLLSLTDGIRDAADFNWYMEESNNTPVCPEGVPADELPDDCREVALTPTTLYRKLDEWGFDSIVIPHGLAWGTVNPQAADFRDQLDEYEQRYQKLLEVYSGHGSSELFVDFERIGVKPTGELYCPPATDKFTPCCQQAGKIVRDRCEDIGSATCELQVEETIDAFLALGSPKGRELLADTTPNDWEGCGQLQGSFQPSSMYIPKMSAQYSLALGFDENGEPKRAKFGLIGSSDGHQGRPGSSYKETNRVLYTDHKDVGGVTPSSFAADKESGAFYYTGGLVAAHTEGRDRDSIWQALDSRNVYATSGNRMLVWFDLLNGPNGEVPMGSEVIMQESPRFRVKALGEFEQTPGCPDHSVSALGKERIESLCGGECYRPAGERRKAVTRIEIVRIRPQIRPDEAIAPLVQDPWRSFDCPADGTGCVVEFEDPDYGVSARSALYYARVIQEPEMLIQGDPFSCEYNEQGECVKRNYCIGENATPDKNCLSEAEPRAWTSPIFVESSL